MIKIMNCCFVPLPENKKRVQWDVTLECNLKCKHCAAEAYYKQGKKMNEHEITEVIKRLADSGIKKVTLSGGEPTMAPNFNYICKELHSNGIRVGIVTNLAYPIGRIKPVLELIDSVTTSIDGNAEIHDQIRGSRCYETTINNLRYIKGRHGIRTKTITTLSAVNQHCIEETILALKELECDETMFALLTWMGRAKNNRKELEVDRESILKHLEALSRKHSMDMVVSRCSYLEDGNTDRCFAGKSIYYLDPNCQIHPCHLMQELTLESMT